MSQPHDFPFDITDVAELLHLRIRRPSPQGLYVDCPICNDKRGKMHINTQTDKCLSEPEFARQVMHPRKNMIRCFRYITRKAKEFAEQEMKDNDEKPIAGGYGCDVPDDMCYLWAEEYFMDMDAEEDKEKEEKFVPKPYSGKPAPRSKKKADKKKPTPLKEPPAEDHPNDSTQMNLFEVGA